MIWALNRNDFLYIHGHVDDPKLLAYGYYGMNRSPENFNQTVTNYGIKYFLLRNEYLMGDPPILKSLSRWKLIYQDKLAAIWERP